MYQSNLACTLNIYNVTHQIYLKTNKQINDERVNKKDYAAD